MTDQKLREYKINAKGQTLGRLASKVAKILMGKDNPDYKPNTVANVKIVLEAVNELSFSDKKLSQKEYQRYSGYPGGRKVFNMSHVIAQHGAEEVLRKAVYGMLPANKLRKQMMKNLIIK